MEVPGNLADMEHEELLELAGSTGTLVYGQANRAAILSQLLSET